MRSALPKPLHPLCGRPMLLHVLDALSELLVDRAVVVVGHGAERVTKTLQEYGPPDLVIDFVDQHVQRGTGDAASVALTAFPNDDDSDDERHRRPPRRHAPGPPVHPRRAGRTPTARPTPPPPCSPPACPTPPAWAASSGPRTAGSAASSRSSTPPRPSWRSTRSARRSTASGAACWRPPCAGSRPENAQGEYYLTDVVGVLHDAGHKVVAVECDDPNEAVGVNDRAQLAAAEAELRRRINHRWMQVGVTMVDPERTYVDAARAPGRRRHPLPRHHPPGPHRRRRGRQARAPRPAGRLRRRRRGQRRAVGGLRRRGRRRRPSSARSPSSQPGSHIPAGTTTGSFYTATAGDEESV